MSELLLMGIDVGTYSSKGVLCTPGGEILAQHQVEHGLSFPRPGWAEHDADGVWWSDLCAVSCTLLKRASVDAQDIAALAISALGADVALIVDDYYRHVREGVHVRELGFSTLTVNHGVAEEWGVRNLARYLGETFPALEVHYFDLHARPWTVTS